MNKLQKKFLKNIGFVAVFFAPVFVIFGFVQNFSDIWAETMVYMIPLIVIIAFLTTIFTVRKP